MPPKLFNSTLECLIQTNAGEKPTQEKHAGLILVHGRGADENDLWGLQQDIDPRFIIASVRAPYEYPFGGYTWFGMDDDGKVNNQQFCESLQKLEQFIADFKNAFNIADDKLFLLGFSMGSIMSFVLSLTKPEIVRGVIAHSGFIPEGVSFDYKWNQLKNTSFFVAHGTEDPVISIELARRSHELLSHSNAQLEYREYPCGHSICDESLSDFSEWLTNLINGKDLRKEK